MTGKVAWTQDIVVRWMPSHQRANAAATLSTNQDMLGNDAAVHWAVQVRVRNEVALTLVTKVQGFR